MLKDTKYPAETLSRRQINKLFAEVESPEDLAILALMYRGGLRVGEVLALEMGDIEFDEDQACEIHIRHAKRDKNRRVALDAKASRLLADWLKQIREGKVFEGQYHKRVERMVAKYAELANIRKRVTPHTLRHTHASELLKEGVDVMTIKEQLGHADLSATVKYLSHLNPIERHKKMKAREW